MDLNKFNTLFTVFDGKRESEFKQCVPRAQSDDKSTSKIKQNHVNIHQVFKHLFPEIYVTVKKVILYTGSGNLSIVARNYLIKNKVNFEEVDVTKQNGINRLIDHTKQTKMPFLWVKSSHGVSTVAGFDEFLYASALNPALSYNEFVKMKQNNKAPE